MSNSMKLDGLFYRIYYLFYYTRSYVYWGEYPLSFAACLGQEECYRLLLARGADPDKQDTNGNTVMHMLVIYKTLASTILSILFRK